MPPKKQAPKKQAVSRPDNSGIPKNDIEFKWIIEIVSSSATINYVIAFQWFGITSDKIQQSDTPLIEVWGKQQDKFVFKKEFGLIRIDDEFCQRLCNDSFYVYVIDPQTNTVKEQIHMDLSGLLMHKGQQNHNISYSNNKLKVIEIQQIKIIVQANKQLISPLYRHYLNPFEIQIVDADNLPNQSSKNYQPTYVKYQFYDGKIVNTQAIVGKDQIVWNHKHVFLIGLSDAEELKQKLRSTYLRFELHDRDQIKNTQVQNNLQLTDIKKMIEIQNQKQKPVIEDPKKKKQEKKEVKKQVKKEKKKDVKLGANLILPTKVQTIQSNFGVAAFFLVDFLKPNNLNLKLTSSIVPRKMFEDYESKNIDLNTTARTQMQKIIASNTYFDNDTNLTVTFTLSYTIGSFHKGLIPVDITPVKEQKKGVKPAPPAKKQSPKKQSKKEQQLPSLQQQIVENKNVFSRIIYMFPYRNPQLIQTIQDCFYAINLHAMNLQQQSFKQLTNMILKPQQKLSRTLDYISGIQVIDTEFRMFIFEGLKQGGMKKFDELIKRKEPNSKIFKILKNRDITFIQRIYTDFNLEIKRIRLRPNLEGLLIDPSIYIRSKVSEDICNTLNNINNIKKIAENLSIVVSMNLWLTSKGLLQVENKFSSSLSKEDISGIPQQEKVRKGKNKSPSPQNKKDNTGTKQLTIKPKTYQDLSQLTPAQRQKELRQQKKREQQLQKSKLVGDATIHIKRGYAGNKTSQVDRYKDILDGSPTKKGLILSQKVTELSKIGVTRFIQSQPVSIFIQQPFDQQKDKLSRIDKPQLQGSRRFNNYQNNQVLTKTNVYKPLKKSNFD